MHLTSQQIASIATGFLDVEINGNSMRLLRTTAAQRSVYHEDDVGLRRARTAAGITLSLRTDSRTLTLGCSDIALLPNYHCTFDVFLDRQFYDSFSITADTVEDPSRPVSFRHVFRLPKGDKLVTLYFPLYRMLLDSVELDDNASWSPYRAPIKWIAFGDSITEGREPDHPGNSYTNRLSRMLNAELFNQGISGEMFRSRKIVPGTYPSCDFVTVAYGTNDFRKQPAELLIPEMTAFLRQITEEFPHTPIFCLLPLWRKDHEVISQGRTLTEVRTILRQEAEKFPQIRIIDCWDFIPHEEDWFYDRRLHPNDAGFACYAEALYRQIVTFLPYK